MNKKTDSGPAIAGRITEENASNKNYSLGNYVTFTRVVNNK